MSRNGLDLITGLTNAGLVFHDVIFHAWNFQESEICRMSYLHDDNFAGWQQCRNVKFHEFQFARMIYAKGRDSRLLISKDVEFMNPRFSISFGLKIDPLIKAPNKPFGNWYDQFYWLLRVVLILRFWVVLILALKLPRAFQEYWY